MAAEDLAPATELLGDAGAGGGKANGGTTLAAFATPLDAAAEGVGTVGLATDTEGAAIGAAIVVAVA